MGIPFGGTDDQADVHVAADLVNVGDVTPWAAVRGTFNAIVTLANGANGTAAIDCSADGGASYAPCGVLGTVVILTAPVREQLVSREVGLLHRIRRVSGAGVMHARISQ